MSSSSASEASSEVLSSGSDGDGNGIDGRADLGSESSSDGLGDSSSDSDAEHPSEEDSDPDEDPLGDDEFGSDIDDQWVRDTIRGRRRAARSEKREARLARKMRRRERLSSMGVGRWEGSDSADGDQDTTRDGLGWEVVLPIDARSSIHLGNPSDHAQSPTIGFKKPFFTPRICDPEAAPVSCLRQPGHLQRVCRHSGREAVRPKSNPCGVRHTRNPTTDPV